MQTPHSPSTLFVINNNNHSSSIIIDIDHNRTDNSTNDSHIIDSHTINPNESIDVQLGAEPSSNTNNISNTPTLKHNNINNLCYVTNSQYSGRASVAKQHVMTNKVGDRIHTYPLLEQVHCNWPNRLLKMSEL
jgi:hypothetical protein